jgi:hypothetical protein
MIEHDIAQGAPRPGVVFGLDRWYTCATVDFEIAA